MMWGDMLLNPKEFPGSLTKFMNADASYAGLLNNLPKDIVICDWQYWNNKTEFASTQKFINVGFKVIGASWKNLATTINFKNYILENQDKCLGMIATTWFHVQREEWEKVNKIIEMSGHIYWGNTKE